MEIRINICTSVLGFHHDKKGFCSVQLTWLSEVGRGNGVGKRDMPVMWEMLDAAGKEQVF